MAKVLTDDTHYKNIADAIRSKGPYPDGVFKPEEMAQNITVVGTYQYSRGEKDGWENGYNEGENAGIGQGVQIGREQGYNEGLTAGQQAEYDRFWDAYQTNGTRTSYANSFGIGWNDDNFQPKYDIRPVNASYMFQYSGIADLAGILRKRGVTLDLSNATNIYMAFYWSSGLTSVPVVDTRSSTNKDLYFLFGFSPNLQNIEKIILKDDGSQTFNGTFQGSPIKEVRFEGVIGKSIRFADSPQLTLASVQSVIDCLKDLTDTSSETLTLHSTVGANVTEEQRAMITAKNWTLVY